MSERISNFSRQEVVRALSTPLARRREVLTVLDATFREPDALVLLVEVRPGADGGDGRPVAAQTWEVTLPVDAEEWGAFDLTTFRIVHRALIEEWWDTKDREPLVARQGRRVVGTDEPN